MASIWTKFNATLHDDSLPVLGKHYFTFYADSYPTEELKNDSIKNVKLTCKSGHEIFKVSANSYASEVESTLSAVSIIGIRLTQREKIVAEIIDSNQTSTFQFQNHSGIKLEASIIGFVQYFEYCGLPPSRLTGGAKDFWNYEITDLLIKSGSTFDAPIDLSDYFSQCNKLKTFSSSNGTSFSLDFDALCNKNTVISIYNNGAANPLMYLKEDVEEFDCQLLVGRFRFYNDDDAKRWFITMSNSSVLLDFIKEYATSGSVDYLVTSPGLTSSVFEEGGDEDMIEAKARIVTYLTQQKINSFGTFSFFDKNFKA